MQAGDTPYSVQSRRHDPPHVQRPKLPCFLRHSITPLLTPHSESDCTLLCETLLNTQSSAINRLSAFYLLYETPFDSIPADALSARTPGKALQIIDLQGIFTYVIAAMWSPAQLRAPGLIRCLRIVPRLSPSGPLLVSPNCPAERRPAQLRERPVGQQPSRPLKQYPPRPRLLRG